MEVTNDGGDVQEDNEAITNENNEKVVSNVVTDLVENVCDEVGPDVLALSHIL